MDKEGRGIGIQEKAKPSSFDAVGRPISAESRELGNTALKDMGVEGTGARWDCVKMVAEQLERDKPHEAMKIAMRYVDATGAYRLFASLLAEGKAEKQSMKTGLDEAKEIWANLGDVPIDKDECIEENFMGFDIGAHREDIWHWIEEKFDVSVATDLMFKEDK